MALVAAGPTGAATVSALPSSGRSWASGTSSSSSSSRAVARLGVERRSGGFLGDSSFVLRGDHDDGVADIGQRRRRGVQCHAGPQGGRGGGGGGRVFFMPFGPGRGAAAAGGRGTYARREWERRQRAQQERIREMIEREMQARSGAGDRKRSNDTNSSYEFSLLRELEKRLRAEEATAAGRREGSPDNVQAQEGATTASSGPSTYELMKELEKRLRAEREGQREKATSRAGSRGREWSTQRGGVRTGKYASLYECMRDWDREMREQRGRLEEQWKSRAESRGVEKKEEKLKDQERWQEENVRGESDKAAEREKEVVNDSSPAATGAKYSQSNGTVVYLKNEANGAEIYLVGTSHVSQKSADEVKEVIERVKPDFVMVELCRKRYDSMKLKASQDKSQRDNPMAFMEQMVRMLTNGNMGAVGKLVGVGLASFYRLLSYRGFHPGKEFEVAIEEGKKVGAKIVLGDQDIETTMKHLGQFNLNMSIQDTFKFFGQRMPDDIAQSVGGRAASSEDLFERMRDRKVVRRFNEEMEKGAPVIYKALLTERNEVMLTALRNLKGKKVVAVVGLAHMDGMEQLWQQANEKYLSGQSS